MVYEHALPHTFHHMGCPQTGNDREPRKNIAPEGAPTELVSVGVVDEQASLLLGFEPLHGFDGPGFAVDNQYLVLVSHAARADDVIVVEAGKPRFEPLRPQPG